MNESSVRNITSVKFQNPLQLSILSFVANIAYPFILTPICSVGFILNLITILVFFRLLSSGNIYKFFLIKTLADSFLLLIGALIYFGTCTNCATYQTIGAIIYKQFFSGYLNTALSTFSAFCEILIAVDRILIIKNKNIKNIYFFICIIFFTIISLLIPSPFFYANYIQYIGNSKYVLIKTEFGTSIEYTYYLTSVFISLNSILFIILLASNFILLFEFKKYLSKKKNLTSKVIATNESAKSNQSNNNDISSKHASTRRLAKMVLTLSFLFMGSRLFHSSSTILSSVNRVKKINFDAFSIILTICSLIINYIMYGGSLIYHSFFNKVFFKSVKELCFFFKLKITKK